jgi:Kef-type K+ transport system membrane component KefB|tara:strand:+ start:2728 stop:4500 length:1773 start_codon:yes stop_codon:yes gene_type:complete
MIFAVTFLSSLLQRANCFEADFSSTIPTVSDSFQEKEYNAKTSSGKVFEKTLAAQFEKVLAKEFNDKDGTESKGMASEGAGRSFNRSIALQGATLETVVRVSRSKSPSFPLESANNVGVSSISGNAQENSSLGKFRRSIAKISSRVFTYSVLNHIPEHEIFVERLIDSSDNEFVISNPKNGTMELQQDHRLITDIVIIICAATIGAAVFGALGQQFITGFLLSGSLIGPGGFGLVVELVQVETLAQFGVVFLLFSLGVEFSISKLRHVKNVSILGGSIEVLLAMLLCGVLSDFSGAPTKEGIFIGGFLSMSSTTVVVKCLMERDEMSTLHGQITLGTLILQDCTIGLLFALLPVLGGSHGVVDGVVSLIQTVITMIFFLVLCIFITRYVICHFMRAVFTFSSELFQLVLIAFCLLIAWLSDHIGLSIELGAFIAGVMVSSTTFSEQALTKIEPIRNLFAALFLTAIGMIMNPYFLWVHLDVLFATLLIIIVFKCSLITLVVRAFGYNFRTSFTVGMSLAQVGEFSFVLLSRASAVGLVHRKLYLLLLGSTALSLIATPVLFKLSRQVLHFGALMHWLKVDTTENELKVDK